MEGIGINGLVVGSSDQKKALKKHLDSRIWTTLLEYISTLRKATKLLVIFKGEDVQQQWFPDSNRLLDDL